MDRYNKIKTGQKALKYSTTMKFNTQIETFWF